MADFRDHFDAIQSAGFQVAGISVDPPSSAALLQAEMFIPFDLLCDTERKVITAWDLLNAKERGGVPVPSVFAIGPGRLVQARSLDTMMRQVHPMEFLQSVGTDPPTVPRKHLMMPRIIEYLKANWRIAHERPAD